MDFGCCMAAKTSANTAMHEPLQPLVAQPPLVREQQRGGGAHGAAQRRHPVPDDRVGARPEEGADAGRAGPVLQRVPDHRREGAGEVVQDGHARQRRHAAHVELQGPHPDPRHLVGRRALPREEQQLGKEVSAMRRDVIALRCIALQCTGDRAVGAETYAARSITCDTRVQYCHRGDRAGDARPVPRPIHGEGVRADAQGFFEGLDVPVVGPWCVVC
ncbi:hypothetical protein ON010_g9911 [Phytophthora cinnamomi]|nr:hypothetical protein ON010_g9911 [Phytophthora cinnamomi]